MTKLVVSLLFVSIVAPCRWSTRVMAQSPATSAALHLADCRGPATSLPDSLARLLPPRTGRMLPDDRWADLASTTPGGFAGVFRDSAAGQILMLTHPERADAARQALAGKVGINVATATVRQARWDFAQLVDWFNYILPHLDVSATADKDESVNRIRLSVTSVAERDRLVRELARLPLPCDLVVVDLNGLTVRIRD